MANFVDNGTQGPTRPIQIDWNVALGAHEWNVEALSLLSQICFDELGQDGFTVAEFRKRELELSHRCVQAVIKRKLDRVGREFRRATTTSADALKQYQDTVKTQDRRTTRRNTVRHFYLMSE